MKDLYHICLTAHSEVLLRDIDDVRIMTNFTALTASNSGTDMLTDSIMSTHLHETVMCESPSSFAKRQVQSLTKAFNHKHGRSGPLFDLHPFIVKAEGPRHKQMVFNYSLRQGMHHGQSETPFAYPWSTCNQLFVAERGVSEVGACLTGATELRDCFCKNAHIPETWQADSNGILLRKSFEQLKLVENWYGTARSYMFSMIRRTSEEWLAEQQKDGTEEPVVTLDLLESGFSKEEIASMLSNEGNPKYIQRGMSDMEICQIIDSEFLHRYHKESVYDLSQDQKERIARDLRYGYGIYAPKQLSRCLAMEYKI